MTDASRHYFKELRLQQFRSLVALARWQTFSAAAAALKITRASVWQQVRGLEQEMECALVRTRGQRVELTSAGQKLVELAAPLVSGLDSVKSALLSAIRDDLPETLVIATPPSFLVHELRQPIARIRKLHPRLQLTFLERNSPAALDLLDQGGADIAIAARLEDTPKRTSLDYQPFTKYPFTFICPERHPLITTKRLTLRHFASHPLIMPGHGTYCRNQFDAVMNGAGLLDKVNIVIESNFPFLLFEYVRMGMGVALSPLPANPSPTPHHAGVAMRNVAHLFGEEEICYVRRKGEFEMPCATAFRELVVSRQAKS
jgi:DNA-binding transcriptional LysR family regulator